MTQPSNAKPATLDVVLELLLLALAAFAFVGRLFGGDPFPMFAAGAGALVLLGWRAARNRETPGPRPSPRPGRWLSRLRGPGLVLGAAFLAALAMQHAKKPDIGIDGPLLYAQVRSFVIDRDLDLTNEFRDYVPERFQHWAEEARREGVRPDPNAEPGPAVLWTPFFAAAHVLVLVARLLGSSLAADGYGAPYVNAVCVASLCWAFVGVCVAYRIARDFFPPLLTAVSLVGFWYASPLIWYSVYEPAMPHAPTTAVVSAFVLLWLRLEKHEASTARWLAVALLGGLLLSTNRYNVYFFVLPGLTFLRLAAGSLRDLSAARLRKGALAALGLLAAFALAALPFFAFNLQAREGQLFRQQHLWAFSLMNVRSPRLGELLFSSAHGLFSWTPLATAGVVGLVLLVRRERRMAVAFLLTLAFGVFLMAASYDWSGGWSFGSRRLTEAFVFFGRGLCAVAEALLRAPQVPGAAALGLFVAWNLLLAGQVERGDTPRVGTLAFRDAAMRAVERVYEVVGHPPSFPASWLFAWRYGVSPERFDRLYGHEPLRALRLEMGTAEAEAFLGRGWSRAESADGVSFRWSDGPDSTVLVPLERAADYRLRVSGAASRSPRGAPQTLTVRVNGAAAGSLSIPREGAELDLVVPAARWRAGLNEIAFVYAWTVRAREVYRTREDRLLAWKAMELELQPAGH